MTIIPDWNGREIEVATSAGGVLATVNPWDNVVRTAVAPWPPPELLQKAYHSRQVRAYQDADAELATRTFGYYSDLQSLNSEDAIAWSVFGPLIYSGGLTSAPFVRSLLQAIDVEPGALRHVVIWLWRRLPHPDSLVSGGPEIDFGIQSEDLFLLGEAKWLSGLGTQQGVAGNKDQIVLRREFNEKYGRRLLPDCRRFVVLGVSPGGRLLDPTDSEADGVSLHVRSVAWRTLCSMAEHPLSAELERYLDWKAKFSPKHSEDSEVAESASPEFSLDRILDLLVQHKRRATYGAVSAIVGRPARSLLQGRSRDRRHSWIVNSETGLPSGYEEALIDPDLLLHDTILMSESELRRWLSDQQL